jgi:hypothetical protein
MSVYNDLANDAGYPYGTEENEMMAQQLEQAEEAAFWEYIKEQQELEELYAELEEKLEE